MNTFREMRGRYVAANAATLNWMLDRRALHGALLNTKMNPLTLADYTAADGLRGPDFLYGWIQGRGLEAIAAHAHFFGPEDRALARKLDEAGRILYRRLAELFARGEDHGFFLYDREFRPIVARNEGQVTAQRPAGDTFTYSDAFFIKGLIAGAARYDDKHLDGYVARLRDLVASIPAGRFVSDERKLLELDPDPARASEFGPWMIVLGAAGLLRRLGLRDEAGFGDEFIKQVLAHNWDGHGSGASDLIPDVAGEEVVNPGHSVEMVGFAHEHLGPEGGDAETVKALQRVLFTAFDGGFKGKGIALSISVQGGRILNPLMPWWSLPETVRAAALSFERDKTDEAADIWRRADEAFFKYYWRADAGIAYQTRDQNGPVDAVPATPDLDPGYHTGLSLLAAIEAMDRARD